METIPLNGTGIELELKFNACLGIKNVTIHIMKDKSKGMKTHHLASG